MGLLWAAAAAWALHVGPSSGAAPDGQAEPEAAVLVTDFEAPAAAAWGWARKGLAELAAAELGARGVPTVDRDLLPVVLAERELAGARAGEPGGLQLGRLLGAAFLLSGSAETSGVSRLRLSGSLTRVETAEQVGAFSAEGDYKAELQALVSRWVGGLTKGLAAARPEEAGAPENPVKPEALMFFQRGVDACAAGKPALAIGYFLSVQDLDPRVEAAREWEAHAYELGGLADYAAAVRRLAGKRTTVRAAAEAGASATQDVRRVVNVLTPVWLGAGGATAGFSGQALRASLEQAVVAAGGVRLFRPESLASALAESDRHLGLGFDQRTTARYARWLTADAALYCAVRPLAGGQVRVEAGLMDALSARRISAASRDVSAERLPAAAAALAGECLGALGGGASARPSTAAERAGALPPVGEPDWSALPDYRELASSLDARMRGQASLRQRQRLADFYTVRRLTSLARHELDSILSDADARAGVAPNVLVDVHWWLAGYGDETPDARMGGRRDRCLLEDAELAAALGDEGRRRVEGVRARLLSEGPASPGAYELLHREACSAFLAQEWRLCISNAVRALALWEAGEPTAFGGRVRASAGSADSRDDESKAGARVRASCLFLRGACLRRLGDQAGARESLSRAAEILDGNPQLGDFIYSVTGVHYNGSAFAYTHTFSRPPTWMRGQVEHELGALADAESDRRRLAREETGGAREARIQALAESSAATPADQLKRLRDIADVWNGLKPDPNPKCLLSEQAAACVSGIESAPTHERQSVAQALVAAYLRVTGEEAGRFGAGAATDDTVARLQFILRAYRALGLAHEGLAWVDAALQKAPDDDARRRLVAGVLGELANGITGGSQATESNIAILHDGVSFTLDEREPAVRAVADLFARYGSAGGLRAEEAAFWLKISRHAELHSAHDVWYEASRRARACDPGCKLSHFADTYVAKLALTSCTQDVLAAALQLRDALGPSPSPMPFSAWYSAAHFFIHEQDAERLRAALRAFRETYNEAELTVQEFRLSRRDSDQSLAWSLDYIESFCQLCDGRYDEAAPRLRRLAQRFGARPIYLWTLTEAKGGGQLVERPLGLMAADALEYMHRARTNGAPPRAAAARAPGAYAAPPAAAYTRTAAAAVRRDEPLAWAVQKVWFEWRFDDASDAQQVRAFNEKASLALVCVDGYSGSFEAGDDAVGSQAYDPFRVIGIKRLQGELALRESSCVQQSMGQGDTFGYLCRLIGALPASVRFSRLRFSFSLNLYNNTESEVVLSGEGGQPLFSGPDTLAVARPTRSLEGLRLPPRRAGATRIDYAVDVATNQAKGLLLLAARGLDVDLVRGSFKALQGDLDLRLLMDVDRRRTYCFSLGEKNLLSWRVNKSAGAGGAELTVGEILGAINASALRDDQGQPLFRIEGGRCVGVGSLRTMEPECMVVADHGAGRSYLLGDWPLDTPIEGDIAIRLSDLNSHCFGHGVGQSVFQSLARRESETHEPNVQVMLGACNLLGTGTLRDGAACAAWYRKAAEQGHAAAMFRLGTLLLEGRVCPRDEAEATCWLKKSAEAGHAMAQYYLGNSYEKGSHVPRDAALAAAWFGKGAAQGELRAMYRLGCCYDEGLGLPEDDREAARWYQRAAELGHNESAYMYGLFLQRGSGGVKKSEAEAVSWFSRSAQHGFAGGMYNLARCYERGLGVAVNAREAARWYLHAARLGETSSMNSYAACLDQGRGVNKDEREAASWYQKSARRGSSLGQNQLGARYLEGVGVEKDPSEAVKWFRLAGEQGNSAALSNLGYCYRNGLGVEKDGREAVKWLRRAVERGNKTAYQMLGECYLEGFGVEKSRTEGVRLLKRAAELGAASAQEKLDKLGQ